MHDKHLHRMWIRINPHCKLCDKEKQVDKNNLKYYNPPVNVVIIGKREDKWMNADKSKICIEKIFSSHFS